MCCFALLGHAEVKPPVANDDTDLLEQVESADGSVSYKLDKEAPFRRVCQSVVAVLAQNLWRRSSTSALSGGDPYQHFKQLALTVMKVTTFYSKTCFCHV